MIIGYEIKPIVLFGDSVGYEIIQVREYCWGFWRKRQRVSVAKDLRTVAKVVTHLRSESIFLPEKD